MAPIVAAIAIPGLLMVAMMFFFMRQMQSSGGAMTFGKSKAKLVSDGSQRVNVADVAGIDEAKDEVERSSRS